MSACCRRPQAAAHYDAADNTALAHRLRHPMLLAHGLLDDDVHPIATLRLAAAAQRAGNLVDLLIVPRGNHAIDALDEVLMRKWEFFCEYLRPAQDGSILTTNTTESNP